MVFYEQEATLANTRRFRAEQEKVVAAAAATTGAVQRMKFYGEEL